MGSLVADPGLPANFVTAMCANYFLISDEEPENQRGRVLADSSVSAAGESVPMV